VVLINKLEIHNRGETEQRGKLLAGLEEEGTHSNLMTSGQELQDEIDERRERGTRVEVCLCGRPAMLLLKSCGSLPTFLVAFHREKTQDQLNKIMKIKRGRRESSRQAGNPVAFQSTNNRVNLKHTTTTRNTLTVTRVRETIKFTIHIQIA